MDKYFDNVEFEYNGKDTEVTAVKGNVTIAQRFYDIEYKVIKDISKEIQGHFISDLAKAEINGIINASTVLLST